MFEMRSVFIQLDDGTNGGSIHSDRADMLRHTHEGTYGVLELSMMVDIDAKSIEYIPVPIKVTEAEVREAKNER